jgi:hypothetical protein
MKADHALRERLAGANLLIGPTKTDAEKNKDDLAWSLKRYQYFSLHTHVTVMPQNQLTPKFMKLVKEKLNMGHMPSDLFQVNLKANVLSEKHVSTDLGNGLTVTADGTAASAPVRRNGEFLNALFTLICGIGAAGFEPMEPHSATPLVGTQCTVGQVTVMRDASAVNLMWHTNWDVLMEYFMIFVCGSSDLTLAQLQTAHRSYFTEAARHMPTGNLGTGLEAAMRPPNNIHAAAGVAINVCDQRPAGGYASPTKTVPSLTDLEQQLKRSRQETQDAHAKNKALKNKNPRGNGGNDNPYSRDNNRGLGDRGGREDPRRSEHMRRQKICFDFQLGSCVGRCSFKHECARCGQSGHGDAQCTRP